MAVISVRIELAALLKWFAFRNVLCVGGGSLKSLDSSCAMAHGTKRDACTAIVRQDLVGKLTDHLKRGDAFQAPLPNGQSVWLPSMPFED